MDYEKKSCFKSEQYLYIINILKISGYNVSWICQKNFAWYKLLSWFTDSEI